MNRTVFKFPSPSQPMPFDGERYTSGVEGSIQREHYHRYLFALHYCVNKHVLDVASGEGYGSFLLGQVAHSVIGIDIDQKAVDFANNNYMSERVSYRRGDAARLPVKDQSVDVFVSFETIEHFANQTDFVNEIDRVLRPDGLLILSSPNREIYSEVQDYKNPFHVREMNKQEFVDLLALRFPHIRLLEQGTVRGSLILPLSGEQSDHVEGFTTRDGQLFERVPGVPGAPYFIALAARAPIPVPPQSVLHSDFYDEQIDKQFAEIEHTRQEQAEAYSQHNQQMADVEASLRAELAVLEEKASVAAGHERMMAGVEASLRAELAVLEEKVSVAAGRERTMAGVEASLRAELAELQEKVSVAAGRERTMAGVEASLRAELAELQEKVSVAAGRERTMAGVEASLRAELAELQEKVSVAAGRERTMAGVEASLRAELGALEEKVSVAAEHEANDGRGRSLVAR